MRPSRCSVTALLITTALTACATGEQPPTVDPFDPATMAEMMRLAQPGPEHEELARYAGQWTGAVSIFMAPGAEPMSQTAAATCTPILGGRFLQMTSSGDFQGQPFESVAFFGFDRRNAEWTLVGFDTLGTYWVSGAGKRGEDGRIRMHGRDTDPVGDQVFFFEIDFVSDEEFVSSVHFSKQGPREYDPPFKMVETRYRRE